MLKTFFFFVASLAGGLLILYALYNTGYIEMVSPPARTGQTEPDSVQPLLQIIESGSIAEVKHKIESLPQAELPDGISREELSEMISWKNFITLQPGFPCDRMIQLYPLEKKLKIAWFKAQRINLVQNNIQTTDAHYTRRTEQCEGRKGE